MATQSKKYMEEAVREITDLVGEFEEKLLAKTSLENSDLDEAGGVVEYFAMKLIDAYLFSPKGFEEES